MNKWIFALSILIIGFQTFAETATTVETASPQAEIGVLVPPTETEVSTAVPSTAAAIGMKELKEAEIPVNLEPAKKAAGSESPMLKFFLSFGIIGVLGCAAYFLIRKYRFKNPQSQATQIKVLTQHYLGPKKSLAIVRVAGESVLIGITDHNISMIKSLSLLDEDIPEESPKEFQTVFNKKTAAANFSDDNEAKDDFSVLGIKDIVSKKMKNLRSLE
ncbi:MAG: FliO/MopB family protein [Pseudobdellovibrionaceae bacterium]